MIKLSNGYEFQYCCASGALGFYGEGWPWERPLKWLKIIDTSKFTVIGKTVTAQPRKGNLKMWCPWRCVQPIRGGWVNAVGLTNPGVQAFTAGALSRESTKDLIASIAPETISDVSYIMSYLNSLPIRAVEVNVSCPNTADELAQLKQICTILEETRRSSKAPVIVKLGFTQPYEEAAKELEGVVEAIDLINTIPWNKLYSTPSPLEKYGLDGGVSGEIIKSQARLAIENVRKVNTSTPIISGGGMDSLKEANIRFLLGANAVSFGVIFLNAPWAPNKIIYNQTRQ